MGSSGGVGDEPQYVVAKYDYIAQGNQVTFSYLLSVGYFYFETQEITLLNLVTA